MFYFLKRSLGLLTCERLRLVLGFCGGVLFLWDQEEDVNQEAGEEGGSVLDVDLSPHKSSQGR